MFNYLIWILVAIIYAPTFNALYAPVLKGLKGGPTAFFNAFGKPWGNVADYTHAYFILPISIWLVLRRRTEVKKLLLSPDTTYNKNIFSFFIFLFGLSMFIFNLPYDYEFISTLSLIPLLYGLVGYLYGIGILKILTFPIFYLVFLVPPPAAVLDSITLPMRYGISFMTESVLKLFNYPITRDGLLLTIGYNEIFMGAPCSGFRSLVTMFSLVLVYIYMIKGTLKKKLILAFFIIPFALLGNLIRVITLCLITFYFGEDAGQGFFHNFSGIVIFVITIFGIIGIESIMNKLRSTL